ncbi:CDP-diacylglycerol--glycerol-3-phosphate 3-phosphatidyltransferase [Cyanidioschyzon merolae strain 10D]|uniref:CDP-diacylglycerol--glycerol-3-phosphate 3-phosphatidyltransferase n=1 Tax=Cyanidioschyzon merolae (strain NIES-3377 / 10D) TaxID=280699 RepID=M1UU05_CYAM1|nr:CDP-diacylglycerol--glycerol-3-phosphate 3-phosphatidyltransferase [Cyanidioschyzon merolae strain 10D]BAM81296.1 CDP-diacylglycerol--glycerol-3-phosphate 3-phosphatidyltransferase [Cyanidioschyzon merolae strain 10D]|eukprot:XP_005537332.1 CDP-diacylglycerol--glycerol-3-phosphate 3-phosphatidyltransferase [Cyanidioschyzon merolae strain 10D]
MHAANLVSLARLVTAPVIGGLIVNDYYSIAALAVAAAGVSDVLDGYLARKYQKVTTLGSILDPVADKVVINATAAALSAKGVLPLGLVGVFLARDSLLILGGAYFAVKLYREARRRDAAVGQPARSQSSDAWPYRVAPLFISKLNTFGQFCTISYASLGAAMGTGDDDPVLQALCWVVGSTTVLSGALYARAVLKAPSGYPSSILRKV